jgi:hypothetical protein
MAQIVFMIFRVVVESLKRLDGLFRVHGEYKLRASLRSRGRSTCAGDERDCLR